MAKKRKPSDKGSFQGALEDLSRSIPEDLRLPSLAEKRLAGLAYGIVIVLPLLDSHGKSVFPDAFIDRLYFILDNRFGGCLVSSSSSSPPFWGLWHPNPGPSDPIKDYVTTVQVFANPIDPTNKFFVKLKEILKEAGNQDEILISRTDCRLL
jgi:hypothetical protein